MTKERKAELFNGLVKWLENRAGFFGAESYFTALKNIGFTREEVEERINDWTGTRDKCIKILDEVYKKV